MKIVITEEQLKMITEMVDSNKVVCDDCGWSWNLSKGSEDPLTCHKCFYNNEE